MAPKAKEHGMRELTVKLEYEREPKDRVDMETFKSVISAAYIYVLGQTVPTYTIGTFDERSRKGTIIMNAKDLNLLWAALSIYGNHFGQKIAFHYFSIKEEEA
uniref:Ribonuclease P n=1 Tax=Panagrolaimus sp. PS1159 TaxID=55785 RepID=A0AC35GSX3_9BILA